MDISNLSREVVTWQLGLINALLEGREKSERQAWAKPFFQSSAPFFTLQRRNTFLFASLI